MPNSFAYLVLIVWPLVAVYFFKKYALEKAVILALLVPYLLLPVGVEFDLPLVPPLNKYTIPPLVVICFLFFRQKIPLFPKEGGAKLLVLMIMISPLFTWFTNRQPQLHGPLFLPGLGFADVISIVFSSYVAFVIPFVVGLNLLCQESSHKMLFGLIVGCGLVYSIPMLYEIRMSPQLHNQIYGFFPHSWIQQIRQGGFRPVVFLGHGLLTAMLAAITFIGVAVFLKAGANIFRIDNKLLLIYMLVVVVLCKTMAALIYCVLGGLVVLWLSPQRQMAIALVVAFIVLLYPVLRSNVIPVSWILEKAYDADAERGQSLEFRLHNEDVLLDKAKEKPLFGWGTWGRSRIYDEVTGRELSVTDGTWIIVFGEMGWVGYVGRFGLFFLAILAVYKNHRRGRDVGVYTAGLCVVLAINLADLIPNSSYSDMLPLVAGALWGRAKREEGMMAMNKGELESMR